MSRAIHEKTLRAEAAPWTSREAAIAPPPRRTDIDVDELDGEIVFFDSAGGRTYHLNRTAYEVWRRCDGRATLRGIATSLTKSFDVDSEQALDDVEQLVAYLGESGLLLTGEPA